MLKFKKEYGLSEIIAILAFVMSGVALYQSHKASEGYIVQGGGIVSVATVGCDILSSIPVSFHNSGKKAVSLRRYIPAGVEKVLLVKSGEIIKHGKPEYEFYITESQEGPIEFSLHNAKKIGPYDLESQSFIDSLIKPGETYEASILVLVKSENNEAPLVDIIMVAVDAEFGDGQVLEVRSSFNAQHNRSGRCSS